MDTQKTPAPSKFTLPTILSLSAAEELREKFLERLVVGSDLKVDASEVNAITTPCLQVIISAGNSFEESGFRLSIENPSHPVIDAFNDLGFSDLINKWSSK
ncbi:MAG: STAS domain-containing protein [Sneathiella sp.]|nr:STAS domain-containing protein [Sneathiella sp.]